MADPALSRWWRHGATWFVGVDALDNTADGSVDGVPLPRDLAAAAGGGALHRAQISAVRRGYPRQDRGESDARHRFRRDRDGAHVDGLKAEGEPARRHLREPHGAIVGIGLAGGGAGEAPLAVYEGSHDLMRAAFRSAFGTTLPPQWGEIDLTDAYLAARRAAFATCPRRLLPLGPGDAVLLHPLSLHGIAPWTASDPGPRVTAFFRPQVEVARWLDAP